MTPIPETLVGKISRSVFNKTNQNIEWARWTWNPITGCLHNCPYCYARDIAERFYPQKFEPTFHENRLRAPFNTKPPNLLKTVGDKNVFVCSMADLFGAWVPDEWITSVLNSCRKNPQWNYLFLTKNPKRYIGIKWPDTAWVGTTADTKKRLDTAIEAFKSVDAPIRFLSCEPLKEDVAKDLPDLTMFDWVIIGGQSRTTGEPAAQPEWSWVENLVLAARKSGLRVYSKPNLRVPTNLSTVPKEYPKVCAASLFDHEAGLA